MVAAITPEEIARLRAPFPLEAHSIREGNKVRNGKGIQWFVYVEKHQVVTRLDEVFPGEWGSTQPVITPVGNGMAATIGITIRGITRGNTGEDNNGVEKAKGATTDAFRRAGMDWGIAEYIYEMDFRIYTDSYPDKDWNAQEACQKEAFQKFAAWYQKKFGNAIPSSATSQNLSATPSQDEPPAKRPVDRLNNGNGKKTIAPSDAGEWVFDLNKMTFAVGLAHKAPSQERYNTIKKMFEEGAFKDCTTELDAVQLVVARLDSHRAKESA